VEDVFLSEDFKKGKVKLVKNKKLYIKKLRDISVISVWLVDGEYVRKNICEDFVNYGHHYNLGFIPKNEFWIAKEVAHDESKYYIDHMLVEHRLMASGMSHDDASKKADLFEKRERSKSEIMKRLGEAKKSKKELIDKVHRKLLKSYSGKVKVWIVSGELVRDLFHLDFAGGGHDKVYHFVPENEIWIDDDISAQERKFIILHELHERNLMSKGMDYDHAHESATETEDFFQAHAREDRKGHKCGNKEAELVAPEVLVSNWL
jgi:hypothetical protein